MRRKPKEIICPKCKLVVAHYDGRGTIDVISKCMACNKRIIYRVNTGKIEIKKIEQRDSSGGMTFC